MSKDNLEKLKNFDINSLPDLDVVTLGALELFSEVALPKFDTSLCVHPLVLGSGNAEITGRVLFREQDALYEDESTYASKLDTARNGINNAVIISASGKKHAIDIAKDLEERGFDLWLFTNNPNAPAQEYVEKERTLIFPRNREPYTYNTSTYMGMMLSKTKEETSKIHNHLTNEVSTKIPDNLNSYDAFYLIIPPQFLTIKDMFLTKFDELFGPRVSGRVFTFEQTKHAKTVVQSDTECFISFGEENTSFGKPENRIHIPLPSDADFVAMLATCYYTIGHIQKQQPSYFKDRIEEYMSEASQLFGQQLNPIVE